MNMNKNEFEKLVKFFDKNVRESVVDSKEDTAKVLAMLLEEWIECKGNYGSINEYLTELEEYGFDW